MRAKRCKPKSFLSTLSAWRATTGGADDIEPETLSIHALRMESDIALLLRLSVLSPFLSTLSAWRATYHYTITGRQPANFLSTLSAWRATTILGSQFYTYPFLSTLSAWRATARRSKAPSHANFLSTLSAWRATMPPQYQPHQQTLSIHALRMESDC